MRSYMGQWGPGIGGRLQVVNGGGERKYLTWTHLKWQKFCSNMFKYIHIFFAWKYYDLLIWSNINTFLVLMKFTTKLFCLTLLYIYTFYSVYYKKLISPQIFVYILSCYKLQDTRWQYALINNYFFLML